MSPRPIDRSPDLRRLRDEGYDVRIKAGYLVMYGVPYVAPGGGIARGVLVDQLQLATDETTSSPADHTMRWAGETPCDRTGQPLGLFCDSPDSVTIDAELTTTHRFSAKPATPDLDYHAKFIRYLRLISAHAEAIDPTITAATFPVIESDDEDSVFVYTDTASSRANITALNARLRSHSIAIVGLGGSGSYILDYLAGPRSRRSTSSTATRSSCTTHTAPPAFPRASNWTPNRSRPTTTRRGIQAFDGGSSLTPCTSRPRTSNC